MDKTKQSTDKEQIELNPSDVRRASDFVSLYINNTRFGYTNWDIQMICGRVTATTDTTQNPVEEIAVIAMSPQHAKAVLKALESNIKIYEDEHGEIKMSEEKQSAQPTKEQQIPASVARRKKK